MINDIPRPIVATVKPPPKSTVMYNEYSVYADYYNAALQAFLTHSDPFSEDGAEIYEAFCDAYINMRKSHNRYRDAMLEEWSNLNGESD